MIFSTATTDGKGIGWFERGREENKDAAANEVISQLRLVRNNSAISYCVIRSLLLPRRTIEKTKVYKRQSRVRFFRLRYRPRVSFEVRGASQVSRFERSLSIFAIYAASIVPARKRASREETDNVNKLMERGLILRSLPAQGDSTRESSLDLNAVRVNLSRWFTSARASPSGDKRSTKQRNGILVSHFSPPIS